MLRRKVYEKLLNWKSQINKKALCITGARQVGKTTVIREFAQKEYEHYVELNFLADPTAKKIFEGSLCSNDLIANLSAYVRKPLEVKKTLVFLDEIQECPQARVAIKFLVQDARFDYIESGSLLGVNTAAIASLPVGFEEIITMFPMDFEEFCWANGVQEETIELLKKAYVSRQPISEVIHETFKRLFFTYLVVGGMPQAVNIFVKTHDISKVVAYQKDILASYRLDIVKYSTHNSNKIHRIFDSIPSQLGEKNRRFVLADLDKNARQNRYESSFLWLNDAGVALPCYNISQPCSPLKLNEKRNLFKLFFCDTGLLTAACEQDIQFELLSGDVFVNWGSVLENAIAQQLVANGFPLRYFNSIRQGEVDFVVEKDHKVLPIEVKSGKSFTSHAALENILAVKDWNISRAIVLCQGNIRVTESIDYLPWYMVMFLKRDELPPSWIHEIDLSALQGSERTATTVK